MKKLFLNIFTLLLAVGAFAQTDMTAQEATDDLVKVYDMDSKQAAQMLVIQQRRVRNLNQITEMKNTDVKKYRHKFRAIQQSTDASIRRMLSEEQMQVYKKRRLEWRENRAAKIADLKKTGLSLQEIEDKLLEEGY